MLRKIILISLPLFVLLVMLTAVVAFEEKRTPDWQQVLKRYIEETRPIAVEVSILESVQASRPWNFDESMGVAYRQPNSWPWDIDRLPFPADALYCVLMQREPLEAAYQEVKSNHQIYYVAHHADALWRVGWVVHEGPMQPFAAAVRDDLAEIGCDLKRP
jgi:hypothetical protein